jgi:hypothetical protein
LSGNSNNGTLINGVGYTSANNGSMVLDGINDYLTVPSNPAWAVGSNATMENWLYFDRTSASTNHRIWCVNNNASSLDIGILVGGSNLFTSGSSGFPNTISPFPSKKWTHLSVVFSAGNLIIYFNGVSQSLTGTVSGINKTSTGTLYLGQYAGGGGYTFQGSAPVFRLYNRALSVAEIRQNFEATRSRYGV